MRIQSMQLLTNAAGFASSIFVPLWARSELGASDFLVGVIVSLFAAATFLSQYIFGRAADNHGKRLFLLAGLAVSAIAVPLQSLSRDPFQLSVARTLVGFSAGIYPPALLAYVYASKQEMGKSVSFGALGWGVGTFVAGLFAAFWQVFLASGIMFAIAFAIALTLPPVREERLHVPLFPKRIIQRNLPVYSALLIRHTGASAIWATLPIYLHDIGATNFQIGATYAINALTQFAVMYNLDRVGSVRSFSVGLLLSSATFVAYAMATNIWLMIIPQVMIAFSWSFMYVGALRFVAERNAEVATSTGLVGSTIALSGMAGPLLGGLVASATGGYITMMYLSALMTLAAAGVFALQLRGGAVAPALEKAPHLPAPILPAASSDDLQHPSTELHAPGAPDGSGEGR